MKSLNALGKRILEIVDDKGSIRSEDPVKALEELTGARRQAIIDELKSLDIAGLINAPCGESAVDPFGRVRIGIISIKSIEYDESSHSVN